MPKFVTMCEGGCCRSVALGLVLKTCHDQDTIACSWKWNPPETLAMLFAWADFIIIMEPHFLEHVPEAWREKTRCVDVGPDRYGHPMNEELCSALGDLVDDWKQRDWKI